MEQTLEDLIERFESEWDVTFEEPNEAIPNYHVLSDKIAISLHAVIEAEISESGEVQYWGQERFYKKEFVNEFKAIIERIKNSKESK